MKRKIFWLLVSALLVLSLMLASCGPAVTEDEEVGVTVEGKVVTEEGKVVTEEGKVVTEEGKVEGKEMVKDSLGRLVEKPQYGGTLNICWGADPQEFDNCYKSGYYCITQDLTYDKLVGAAWIKGPTGTNEIGLYADIWPDSEANLDGRLAISWELPDPNTITYHLREGVYFHNKSPVNGRELVAEDVVFSIKRLLGSPACWLSYMPVKPTQYLTPDKYTIVLKFDRFDASIFPKICNTTYIVPRDAVAKDPEALRDWKNECGTGPFILEDYVKGNSITFERNPNYWGKEPLHPENQRPYVDSINMLIVPDESTRIALLRTGKIDHLQAVRWQHIESLIKSNPDLKFVECPSVPGMIRPRVDKPPFDDIRVRKALSMAINRDVMINDMYQSQAYWEAWPLPSHLIEVFTPFEQLPAEVRENFAYDPEKAKKLLVEAGYPNGFETELVCTGVDAADMAAFIKGYWAAVGVDTEIRVVEPALMTSLTYGRNIETAGVGAGGGVNKQQQAIQALDNSVRTPTTANYGNVSDAKFDSDYADICATFDLEERIEKMKVLGVYTQTQVYVIELPAPKIYSCWHSWLKGYSGETSMELYRYWGQYAYAWLDQDMRQATTGKR